jgi:hypothetical protein
MVKFSDDSPEYRIVIGFLDSILPVVPLDSSVMLGLERVKASDGQGSSRPRKSKAQKGLYGRSSGFAADSSRAFAIIILSCLIPTISNSKRARIKCIINSKKALYKKSSEG